MFKPFLSLDISSTNTGWAVFVDTARICAGGCIYNTVVDINAYKKQLKEKCLKIINKYSIKEIVIENAFTGINHKTNEKLFIVNNSINELNVEQDLGLSVFHWENSTWKSGLLKLSEIKVTKRKMSKETTKLALEALGFTFDHLSKYITDDFIDALGMGYYHANRGKLGTLLGPKNKSSVYSISKPRATSFVYIMTKAECVDTVECQLPEALYLQEHGFKRTLEKSLNDFYTTNDLRAVPYFILDDYHLLGADLMKYTFMGDLVELLKSGEDLAIIALHKKLKVEVSI